MKKIILFALMFGLTTAYAQEADNKDANQTEKADKKESKKKYPAKYKTWAVGIDVGKSTSFMDMYTYEAGKGSIYEQYGDFEIAAGLRLEKWFSSYFGFQGQYSYGNQSGSKKDYAFTTDYHRIALNLMLNLSGVGANNKAKPERKAAWILHVGLGSFWNKPDIYGPDPADPTSPILYYQIRGNGSATLIDGETTESWNNAAFISTGIEWRYRFANSWDLKIFTQPVLFMSDNVEGSRTLEVEEKLDRHFFENKTNDVLLYSGVGVNWYWGGKGTKDKDIIIYTNPFTELEQRVSALEDNVGKLMEDGDNDGVSDYFDKDPETPEGYVVDGAGVSQDTDKDGIPDELDEDPYSTKGAQVDANGREYDQDADGVPDSQDLEQNTPAGQLVNYQGVSIKDRIGGAGGNDSYFLPSVYFDFNKSFVTKANYQRMAVIANYLKANPDVKLDVVGHTDPVGTEAYNQNLSERRAKAVVKAFVNDFDIDESRLNVTAKGESELISKRNDINRRVEFRIK